MQDLTAVFETDDGVVQAVDGVSFDVHRGEVFSIVGESGSGKSVTAMTIMGLLPTVKVRTGSIMWKGQNLLDKSENEMRHIRGGEIAMIFQDPLTALNPVHTVGRQVAEMGRIHLDMSKKEAVSERSRCSTSSGFPRRASAPRCTPTSSRAECGSGR